MSAFPVYPVRVEGRLDAQPEPLALAGEVAAGDPALHRPRVPVDRVFVLSVVAFVAILFTGATRVRSSTSTSACCAGPGVSGTTPSAPSRPTAIRRSRSPSAGLSRDARDRLSRPPVAGPRPRQVVAARLAAVSGDRVLRRWRRWVATHGNEWFFGGGLVSLLALFAVIGLLFTGRYPGGIFDLILGLDRWVCGSSPTPV